MRRYILLYFLTFLLCLSPVSGQPGEYPNTLLWKIEGNGLAKPSYLYGTMHTADDIAFGLMDSVLIAFESCEKYAMEVNPDSIDEEALAADVLLPPGTTLKNLLKPDDYELVKKVVWKRLHLPMFIVERIKPFYVAIMLQEGIGDADKTLDMYFAKLAKKQEKPVLGLEDPKDQLKLFDGIPMKKQVEMLLETVKDNKYDVMMDSLMAVYSRRDLTKIDSMVKSDTSLGAAFMKQIVDDRNEVMAKEISRLAKVSPVFAAVGAAHLPGEEGVIAKLQRMGYTVRPVMSGVFLKPKYVKKQAK